MPCLRSRVLSTVRYYGKSLGGKNTPSDIRRINIGCMITYLQSNVPHVLQIPLHEDRLSKDIQLSIMQVSHPYLPTFKGITTYYATWNSITFMLNNLVFKCPTRLMIKNLAVDKNNISMKWETCPVITDADTSEASKDETTLTGLFVFQLNDDCDKIEKHIVDDMEVVGKNKKIDFEPRVENGAIVYCKQ